MDDADAGFVARGLQWSSDGFILYILNTNDDRIYQFEVFSTESKAYTADSLIQETLQKPYTTDAIINRGKLFTLDALIQKTSQKVYAVDSFLQDTIAKMYSVDAHLVNVFQKSFSFDSFISDKTKFYI